MFEKGKISFLLVAVLFIFFIVFTSPAPVYSSSEYEFDSIQFFEGTYDPPEESQWHFTKTFPKASTRYVWCLLKVKNLLNNVRSHQHEVTFRSYYPDGSLLGEQKADFLIKPEWEYSWIPRGWGWKEAGNWEPGTYSVEVLIDGIFVGRETFQIVGDTTSSLELESVKFFESALHVPPQGDRIYTDRFPKSKTRYVYFNVRAKNLLYNQRKQKPLVIGRFFKPDGSLFGEPEVSVDIPSDWEEADLWTGWGWDEPGNWTPGTYRVEIFFESTKVAEKQFVIYDDTSVVSSSTSNVNEIIDRGVNYIESGDMDSAIREFKRAIEIDPMNGDAYYNAGVAYSNKKDYDNAMFHYTKAIEINPKDFEAFNNRGIVYENKGDQQKAISDYSKAIKIKPDYDMAHNNRGVVYYSLGDYDKAMSDYNRAISINPLYKDAYYNRGIIYYDGGDYDRAIAEYTRTIEIDPMYADAYYNRGLAYDNKGEYDKSIADYTKAIEINPADTDAYINRGLAYDKKGQKDMALLDYNKAGEKEKVTTERPDKQGGKKRKKIYSTAIIEFTERGDLNVKDAGAIVAEWMTSSMIETGVFDIYTRLSIKDIIKELEFQSTDFIDAKTAARAGKVHGVEAIVTGSVIKFGNMYSVTVKLIDTETAKIIDSADVKAKSLDELSEKIDDLAMELARE